MKRILNIAAITAMMVLTASLRNTAAAQDDEYYDDGCILTGQVPHF